MRLTFSSVFICLLCSGAASLGLFWILNVKKKSYIYSKYILVGIMLIVVRCLIPFEFFYTVSFYSHKIFPFVQDIGRLCLTESKIPLWRLFLWIWVGGAVIKACYIVYKQWRWEHLLDTLPHSKYMPVLRTLLAEKNILKSIQLIEFPINIIPSVVGLRTPKIVVPDNLSDKDLYYILLHELEHYQSGDLYLIALSQLLCIIYWWNPLLYLLNHLLKKMIEFRVDSKVVENLDEEQRLDYSQAIINVLKQNCSEKAGKLNTVLELSICNNYMGLKERFKNIFDYKKTKYNYVIVLMAVVLFFLSTGVVIEPSFRSTEMEKEYFTIPKDAYVIHELDGTYKLYVNDEYFGTLIKKEFAEEWTIYERSNE